MSDQYAVIRAIPLLTVFQWLGVDTSQFKSRKAGREHFGKCPFHDAKTNTTSFSFTADLANCFSCGVKFRGSIDAVKLYQKVNFKEAVFWLQERLAIVGEGPMQKSPTEASSGGSEGVVLKPYSGSYEKFQVPSPWLEARVADQEIRELYGVFCYDNKARKSAYSGRVMIPIKDVEGVLWGYLGRSTVSSQEPGRDTPDRTAQSSAHQRSQVAVSEAGLESASSPPKYLLPKNFPKSQFLFGADVIAAGRFGQVPLKYVYLVESPFSVMKFASLGLPAVSSFGWSVSQEQIGVLRQISKGTIHLPDRNKYLESASSAIMLASAVWLRMPLLPDGIEDPESLSLEQILALTR